MSECLNCGRDCGVLRYRGLCKQCVKNVIWVAYAYDEGRRHALQASQINPSTPPEKTPPVTAEIDYQAIVTDLRKANKPTQSCLVEYMADKREATAEEVAVVVHGHSETSRNTIWANLQQTNKSLAKLGSPLSFRMASGRVFREISSN